MNTLKKIFSYVCLFVSIFLFIYVFYRSYIYWDGEKNSFYQIYYIISIVLIIFSLFTFYINEKIKEYLIIILISTLSVLYIFEIYLIYNNELLKESGIQKEINIKQTLLKNRTGKEYDVRTRYEIYSDLKKNNPSIQVSFHTSKVLTKKNSIFPFAGISNSETIFCNENGYYSIYESDRYGFNNPDKEWDQKNFEFLLVGDSHTHGACVNRPDDIASVLRTLSNKSVLNLGYSGWGPLIKYAILREYLVPNVNNILWIYFEGNDLDDLQNELQNDLLKKYLENFDFSQNLKSKQKEIDDFAKEIISQASEKKINFNIIKFFKITNVRINLTSYFVREQKKPLPISEFENILLLTQKLAEKNGSNLYFVYLPEYDRYKNSYDNSNYILIKNMINKLDIPFIDIHKQVFQKEKDPLNLFPFKLFGHFSEKGYEKITKAIYKSIQ